ncbi:hypothetical protein LTR66_008233 [Elasticomyces elasticus]|nr:hypothetical protein LTR66_008233 [Elasticomyces elasticus]
MDRGQNALQGPHPQSRSAPIWSTTNAPPWSTATRPLSDIRELTEPSLVDVLSRKPSVDYEHKRSASRCSSLKHSGSIKRNASVKIAEPPSSTRRASIDGNRGRSSPALASRTQVDGLVHEIPSGVVPRRSSSRKREEREPLPEPDPSLPPPPPRGKGHTIPNHGHARSPIKEALLRPQLVGVDPTRRAPSRTFVRQPQPVDMLEFPTHRHSRISVDLQTSAPLFVGGGSIEGSVKVMVDDAERIRQRRSLALARISIDLVGVEEVSGTRRCIFLSLGTELVDAEHPPPPDMVESSSPLLSPTDPFWVLTPSVTVLPFMLSLPLDTGAPPFYSKHARIRYMLSVTLLVKNSGKQYLVRSSHEVSVLSTYDPVKALTSLPSPLTASDEYLMPRGGTLETVRVTAGLHRQVWVSGTSLFVDVHIANDSRKTIKRLDLTLERDVLIYKHAAAATLEKSASQARIFSTVERTFLTKSTLKHGTHGWNGVAAYSSETRMCDLDLPRGHATVKCGKYFEVRYFINVTASTAHKNLIVVQLPIILIHMVSLGACNRPFDIEADAFKNSVDSVPNAAAQVAAAVEEKRAHFSRSNSRARSKTRRSRPSSPQRGHTDAQRQRSELQGIAFAAPRQQSLSRIRAEAAAYEELGEILDRSPRKNGPHRPAIGPEPHDRDARHLLGAALDGTASNGGGISSFIGMEYHTPPPNRRARLFEESVDNEVEAVRNRLRRMRSMDSTRSKKSSGTAQPRHAAGPSLRNASSAVGLREIPPYSLGLGNNVACDPKLSLDAEAEDGRGKVGKAPSFRDKIEQSRFEFKAVKKKSSGALRGLSWWEQKRNKEREREGWI